MKITLIKSFKNHQIGRSLDVSKRIYNMLLERGCIADPRPIEFTDDVIKAAQDLEPKKPSKNKKTKALDKPPADRMIREAETK